MSIFMKENFTLKELCLSIDNCIKSSKYYEMRSDISNMSDILDIIQCYLYFTSNNNNYIKLLKNVRLNKGIMFLSKNNKYVYFREILQIFDLEFTKLVIRIKTDSKDYDITISWKDFQEKLNITKEEFENYIKLYKN